MPADEPVADRRLPIFDCRFAIERRCTVLQSAKQNQKFKIENQESPRRAYALPLAEFIVSPRGMGSLQHVDQFAREQVRDDIVDRSEKPVCVRSSE